jgi:prepilin-type N-terminal cleavage/methylation domain-containing protein
LVFPGRAKLPSNARIRSQSLAGPFPISAGMSLKGFTLVEVLVALVIFAIGALGVAAETAALTRRIAQEHLLAVVSEATTSRLERLRANACRVRNDGMESVSYRSIPVAEIQWSWRDPGDSTYGVTLVTVPSGTRLGTPIRSDTLRASVWCRR